MLRKPSTSRGFTLIELLISMSIFALITGFTAANYRTGRRNDELRQGSQLLASSLRRLQTMALSGQSIFMCTGTTACTTDANCGSGLRCMQGLCVSTSAMACSSNATCTGGTTCNRVYPSGYGIRLTTVAGKATKSVSFVDINGNRAYDVGEEFRTDSISAGPFVSVTSVSPAVTNALDIVIEPPKPNVWFNGSSATGTATIVVTHSITGSTRTITFNRVTGQVSAD